MNSAATIHVSGSLPIVNANNRCDLSLTLGTVYDGTSAFSLYGRRPWSDASAAQSFPTSTTNHSKKTAGDDMKGTASSTVPPGGSTTSCCQAQGCDADLSRLKDYHRRHKVCDFHSKASAVMVSNIQQRFCQQCSKFHALSEFDGEKRSCRCRLATHNQRRQHRRRANRITSTSSTVPQNHRYHPYHPHLLQHMHIHTHPPTDADADADAVADADDRGCALSFLLPNSDAAVPTSRSCSDDHDRLCALSPLLTSDSPSSSYPCSSPDAAASPTDYSAMASGSSLNIMATNSGNNSTSRGTMELRPFHFVLLHR